MTRELVCAECGGQFTAKRSDARYCGECAAQRKRQQKRAWQEANRELHSARVRAAYDPEKARARYEGKRDERREYGRRRYAVNRGDPEWYRRARAVAVRYQRATQSETRDQADHNGEPWAEWEVQIALRRDLTVAEAALLLGRTYCAIQNTRYRYRKNQATDGQT